MKWFLFSALLISGQSSGAEDIFNCPEPESLPEKILRVLKPQNPLATRKIKCIEASMPSTTSALYSADVEAMKTNTDIRSEGYMYPWLYVNATESSSEKIKKVYEVSAKYNIPPAILYGAIGQESSWMEMGLAEDYGNWACGLAQLNVNDWCNYASHADAATQEKIKWPHKQLAAYQKLHPDLDLCDPEFIVPEHARPFYDVALKRLRSDLADAPEYMLKGKHANTPRVAGFAETRIGIRKVSRASIEDKASASNLKAEALRYAMTASFAGNCSDFKNGIEAAAFTFQQVFKDLPKELQNAQRFKPGEEHPNSCQQNTSDYYPLHVGWLLANAVYNAGPEILPGVFAYQKNSKIPWENFSPENLIEAIQFALAQKDNGLSAIGAQEAKDHVRGVLNGTSLESEED